MPAHTNFGAEMCTGHNSTVNCYKLYPAAYINRKQRIGHREPSSAAQPLICKLPLPLQQLICSIFQLPKSAVSRLLRYLRNLQRSESRLAHLRYNVHQVHRRYNLPNSALNRVREVVLAARLKHGHAVAGVWGAAHDRLGRFQAVGFDHHLAVVNLLFVCCPALWWNYLGS
jgi:hypothetical protein